MLLDVVFDKGEDDGGGIFGGRGGDTTGSSLSVDSVDWVEA